jgi:hypothetical protein
MRGTESTGRDLARVYEIAVRNGFVDPFDSDAVVRLIGCFGRYADQLTTEAREIARREREARIVALRETGKSNREAAREPG